MIGRMDPSRISSRASTNVKEAFLLMNDMPGDMSEPIVIKSNRQSISFPGYPGGRATRAKKNGRDQSTASRLMPKHPMQKSSMS